MSHDYEILDILDGLEPREYSGVLWRTTWLKRDSLLGGTGGGRWSPSKKFEALYASLDKNVSIAELHYHLSQAPVLSSSAVAICELHAEKINLLDLTSDETFAALNLSNKAGKDLIYHSQKIGAAAYFLEYQGILVPSVRAEGNNCVLFSERLLHQQISEKSKSEINWPAWIREHKNTE